jgi:hypothetical protein
MSDKKQYDILSPDGIAISFSDTYSTFIEMARAFINWKNNFKKQGYYSSGKYGRIHLDDLRDYCEIVEV